MLEMSWLSVVPIVLALTLQLRMTAGWLTRSGGCEIRVKRNDLLHNMPLVLTPSVNGELKFFYPNKVDIIHLKINSTALFACPGSGFVRDTSREVQKVECLSGNQYLSDYGVRRFSYFLCQDLPDYTIKKAGMCLNENHTLYKIGFYVNGKGFADLFDLCFDPNYNSPLYTKHTVVPVVEPEHLNFKPIKFDRDHIFRQVSPKYAYSIGNQEDILLETSNPNLNDLFFEGKWLVKTVLTPGPDLVYRSQQMATHMYANTAPMWSAVREGNWETLETSIRYLANNRNVKLTVYTGVEGIIHVDNVALYMTRTPSGRRAIPVPSFFWKVVHDETTNQAVGFILANHPAITYDDFLKTKKCVPNMCSELTWINFDEYDLHQGFITCCRMKTFNKIFRTIPKIHVDSILN